MHPFEMAQVKEAVREALEEFFVRPRVRVVVEQRGAGVAARVVDIEQARRRRARNPGFER